jgi:hypothetical protein
VKHHLEGSIQTKERIRENNNILSGTTRIHSTMAMMMIKHFVMFVLSIHFLVSRRGVIIEGMQYPTQSPSVNQPLQGVPVNPLFTSTADHVSITASPTAKPTVQNNGEATSSDNNPTSSTTNPTNSETSSNGDKNGIFEKVLPELVIDLEADTVDLRVEQVLYNCIQDFVDNLLLSSSSITHSMFKSTIITVKFIPFVVPDVERIPVSIIVNGKAYFTVDMSSIGPLSDLMNHSLVTYLTLWEMDDIETELELTGLTSPKVISILIDGEVISSPIGNHTNQIAEPEAENSAAGSTSTGNLMLFLLASILNSLVLIV